MKKHLSLSVYLCALGICSFVISSCTNKAYVAPKVEWGISSDQKSVAIVPFDVVTKAKRLPKDMSVDELREKDRVDAMNMQRDMYRYFLRGMSKNGLDINFIQDVNQTNDLLEQVGIAYADIKHIPREELADILNVDAVLFGTISQRNDPFFSSILVGELENSQTVNATFMLYQRTTGKLLWRFEGKASGANGEDVYALCKKVMRQAPDNFPFEIL